MAYATISDYIAVYDTDATQERLEAYLDKASRKIDAAIAMRGAALPEEVSEELSAALRDVCCDMVHRVMPSSGGGDMPDGITSYSQTEGGFSESFSWAQPYTDLSVRADEIAWLLVLIGRAATCAGVYRMWGGEVT